MTNPIELLQDQYPGLIDESLQSTPVSILEMLSALAFVVEEEEDPGLILPAIRAAFALGRWSVGRGIH